MIEATMKKGQILVEELEQMGEVGIAIVKLNPVDPFNCFKALPAAIEIAGRTYGKSAWNSDRMIAYYRTDRLLATIVKGGK